MKRLLSLMILGGILLAANSAFAYKYTFQCGGGGGPRWARIPVSYWINQNGSDNIAFSSLTKIMEDSFSEWGKPCCSEFSARYQGKTSETALRNSGKIVLSWQEQNWPTMLGNVNSVIGVTLMSAFNNCTISQAPIVFNGVGFSFRTDGNATDMQSISTHEIGHLLGLGHSDTQSATMYAAYTGGNNARSLHQDDENGVCSLYTITCNCTNKDQCKSGQDCINARCKDIPCGTNNPCKEGKKCNTQSGVCEIPRCKNDGDCKAGLECSPKKICQSKCASCRTCADNTDCGGNGNCADIGNGPKCYFVCNGAGSCEGDSTCTTWQFQGQNGPQNVSLCSAAGNNQLPCPDSYICKSNSTPKNECETNANCNGGKECVSSGGRKVCQDPQDPCNDVKCKNDQTCRKGKCIDNSSTNNNNKTNNNTSSENNQTNNTNNPSSNNGNSNGDDDIVILNQKDSGTVGEPCSVSPQGHIPGALLFLAIAFGIRRRKK